MVIIKILGRYSTISNNRAGCNKRAGWQIPKKTIIVQDVINVQDGKSQKINKRAGWQSPKKQEKCRLAGIE